MCLQLQWIWNKKKLRYIWGEMSFKRDGDDSDMLANLQRRRVSELLSAHIPADEALLLKNGRLTCLVCKHRPTFDTMNVLTIHRTGRKHLQNLSSFLVKQEELKELVVKRKQEQFLKTGNTNIQMGHEAASLTQSSSKKNLSMLGMKPYSSCCKRKSKPTDRKLKLVMSSAPADPMLRTSSTSSKPNSQHKINATVKSYLKSMTQKGSFEDVVQNSRLLSSLPGGMSSTGTSSSTNDAKSDVVSSRSLSAVKTPLCEEDRMRHRYYRNLRRDGWKKDTNGGWIKDEDAEFDTDEEEPLEYTHS